MLKHLFCTILTTALFVAVGASGQVDRLTPETNIFDDDGKPLLQQAAPLLSSDIGASTEGTSAARPFTSQELLELVKMPHTSSMEQVVEVEGTIWQRLVGQNEFFLSPTITDFQSCSVQYIMSAFCMNN